MFALGYLSLLIGLRTAGFLPGLALAESGVASAKARQREQTHAQDAPASEHGEHPPFDRARAEPLDSFWLSTTCGGQ